MTYGFLCSALWRGERAASAEAVIDSRHDSNKLPCIMMAVGLAVARGGGEGIRHRIWKVSSRVNQTRRSRDMAMQAGGDSSSDGVERRRRCHCLGSARRWRMSRGAGCRATRAGEGHAGADRPAGAQGSLDAAADDRHGQTRSDPATQDGAGRNVLLRHTKLAAA